MVAPTTVGSLLPGSTPDTSQSRTLNRNLPPDLDHLITRQAKEIADMYGVAFHYGEQSFLPSGQSFFIPAAHDGFMANVISNIVEIHCAAKRSAGTQKVRNLGPLHEAIAGIHPPEIRC